VTDPGPGATAEPAAAGSPSPAGDEAGGGTVGPRGDAGRAEAIAGAILVGLVLLAALWFRARPAQTVVDSWGFSFVHPALDNWWWKNLAELKSLTVLVAGSILAAVVVVSRDRWRALACLTAPVAAVVLTEYFLKPVVDRHYDGVISFPSGTTTAVSALAMVWVLAVPGRFRPVVAVVGAFVVGLECMAVVGLLWHYPTDAVGGAVFGAGVVLLVDGALHLVVDAERRWRSRQTPAAGRPTGA
jgi:membrane-associated phospholipid phosphatase